MESKSDSPVNAVPLVHVLPKNSQHRIQTIGVAATSVAAAVWLVAALWAWQIVA